MNTSHLAWALGAAALIVSASPALAALPGEQGYIDNCSACHQRTGLGIPGAFPALKGSQVANGPPTGVAATVLYGRGGMPAFKDSLTDAQLSQITSYVRVSWGNKAGQIPPMMFAKARKGPPPSTRPQAN